MFINFLLIYYIARFTNRISLLKFYVIWEIYYAISHLIIAPFAWFGKIDWVKK